MTEDELLAAVLQLAGWLGLLAYHSYDSRRSEGGFPDLVICGREGVLFVELKSQDGVLSRAQKAWRWRLRAAGARWMLWRPADWYSLTIEKTLREIA